jgi:phosphoribosylamine--glycine ligase
MLRDGKLVTSGGRVLGVTAAGKDLAAALSNAYRAVEKISFEGIQYRSDIGSKGLKQL